MFQKLSPCPYWHLCSVWLQSGGSNEQKPPPSGACPLPLPLPLNCSLQQPWGGVALVGYAGVVHAPSVPQPFTAKAGLGSSPGPAPPQQVPPPPPQRPYKLFCHLESEKDQMRESIQNAWHSAQPRGDTFQMLTEMLHTEQVVEPVSANSTITRAASVVSK